MAVLTLELASAPLGDADAATQALVAAGYTFFTLAQAADADTARRKLYALVREGVLGTPGFSGTFEDYRAFSERIYARSYLQHAESQFLAAYGDEWVGLSSFVRETGERGRFGLSVVTRAHRGRGLARALKLRALRYAKGVGVTAVTTENHAENRAILGLNEALGFRRA